MIMSKTLPFTQSNSSIRTFRHALALDEHRAKFVPTFYHWPAPSSSANKKNPERAGSAVGSASTSAAKVESAGPLADEEQGETHLLDTKSKETKRRWSLLGRKVVPADARAQLLYWRTTARKESPKQMSKKSGSPVATPVRTICATLLPFNINEASFSLIHNLPSNLRVFHFMIMKSNSQTLVAGQWRTMSRPL